jgi:hypothetical protein
VSEHELLTAEDLVVRYRLRDVRTARALMNRAGAFKLAGRLYLRADDLVAYEDDLRQQSTQSPPSVPIARARQTRRTGRPAAPLRPGWWRDNNKELA